MNTRIYLYVKAFSDLGSRMDMIVLNAMMYIMTESVVWLSASMAITVLGGMISSLFSGILADQWDRRKMMIFSDILRAAAILLLIPFPDPIMILIVRFSSGFLNSFFQVSYTAEIPQIYGSSNILGTNSIISRLGSISMVTGFLIGGLFYEYLGASTVLALDSFSFIVSALVLYRLRWDSFRAPNKTSSGSVFSNVLSDFREVKRYLKFQPLLLLVLAVYLTDTFGSASHNLGFPLLAEDIDVERQALVYGLIWSVWGVGNVIMTYFLPKINWIGASLHRAYFISTIFMSLGFMSIFTSTYLPLVLLFAFLTGIADACSVTIQATIIQKCENGIRGRIAGISNLLNTFGFGCGFLAASFMLKHISLNGMVWILHTVVILITLTVLYIYLMMQRKERLKAV
jgi:MFS family permease